MTDKIFFGNLNMDITQFKKTSKLVAVIANQGTNSLSSVIMMYFLVRSVGIEQFGIFSVCVIIATQVMSALNALIAQPLVSISSQKSIAVRLLMIDSSVCVMCSILIALACLAILGIGIEYLVSSSISPYAISTIALSIVMTLTEFWRRVSFLQDFLATIWGFDVLRYGLLAFLFFYQPQMTIPAIYFVNALTVSMLVPLLLFSAIPLFLLTKRFVLSRTLVNARRLVRSGKWLSLFSIVQFLNGNMLILLASQMLGAYEVGVVRICQSILGVSNPLIQALENVVPRWLGLKVKKLGTALALKQYHNIALILAGGFTAMFSMTALFSNDILSLISVEGNANADTVLQSFSFAYLFTVINLLVLFELRFREFTASAFICALGSSAISILIAFPMLEAFGVAGVGFTLLINRIVGTVLTMFVARKVLGTLASA